MLSFRLQVVVRLAKHGSVKLADRPKEMEKEIADRLNKKNGMFFISVGNKPICQSRLVALFCLLFDGFPANRFGTGGN